MKGILNILAAAKLVTLSDEEIEPAAGKSLPTEALLPQTTQEIEPPPPTARPAEHAPAPGKRFDELYQEAGVPPSPFPAERLLRLLDGLRAMDEATRKAAVRAMDEADEQWCIDDPIQDAQRKIAALSAFRQDLAADIAARKEQTAAGIAALHQTHEQTSAEIRRQISELEKLLERETRKTGEQVAALDAETQALERIASTEDARMAQEIARLREIPAQFASHSNQP